MKKGMMFIAAAIFVFCIVAITTTQAMPRQAEKESLFASTQPNAVQFIFNQKKLRNIGVKLSNQLLKDNDLTYDTQELREIMVAQQGSLPGNPNPYVRRRGHGRSTMGDTYDNETKHDVGDEDTDFGDDSAIKYNRDLNDTSGYNEDL